MSDTHINFDKQAEALGLEKRDTHMGFGPEFNNRNTMFWFLEDEPLAYKYVGEYSSWLVTEYDDYDLSEIQPMYAPIEDEE
jgi:membrane carboxypeptidase/penicillin-binding protein PbpC